VCGIFGVFNAGGEAAEQVAIGLHALQHRAIDYAGIVSTDGQNFFVEKGAGTARQVFSEDSGRLSRLHGPSALGHIRYPTVTDDETRDNIQPIVMSCEAGQFALAHNGNLTNVAALRRELEKRGGPLKTSMDTECFGRLFCEAGGLIVAKIAQAVGQIRGTVTMCMLFKDCLIGIRDPSGCNPLSIGRRENTWFLASETCAFDMVEADFVRHVRPGEVVFLSRRGITSHILKNPLGIPRSGCIFQNIYYMFPSSLSDIGMDLDETDRNSEEISDFRLRLGRRLAELFPVPDADVVMPVPDSANLIAAGWTTKRPAVMSVPAILRNHYLGRTFIAADQAVRNARLRQKLSVCKAQFAGKVVVVIDDSIVRGNTMRFLVRLVRSAGARASHIISASPRIKWSCRYGIDTPTDGELLASRMTTEEMRAFFAVDSLNFLPIKELRALSPKPESCCYACMTGRYPLPE